MSIGGVSESWARLRLVQGDSSARAWELVASRDPTTLTVGSGSDCSWVVKGPGVQPAHFSLHWDGAALRIADTLGSGDVRLDGAPVDGQWRPIVGHARIDFGQASMMVDTSSARTSDSDHPLDPGSVPPATPDAAAESGPLRRIRKGTLLGVSPLARELGGASADSVPPPGSASVETGADAADSGEVRAAGLADSDRLRKATLLGVAINFPGQGSSPPGDSSAPAASSATPGPLGAAGRLEASAQRMPPANDPADKRTLLGMPIEQVMGFPPRTEPPVAGSVARAEVRAVSAAPSAEQAERVASAWHEVPGREEPGSVPMAVLLGREGQGVRGMGANSPRPAPILDPGPSKRGFPLQYVGIIALTAAAYFAWLYLLDHL